jgi:hypothetical protein
LCCFGLPLTRTAVIAAGAKASRSFQEGKMEQDLTAQVRALAYKIWELEGRPTGRERIHWLRAEAEVREKFQNGGHETKPRPYRLITGNPKKSAPPMPLQVRFIHSRYARLANR